MKFLLILYCFLGLNSVSWGEDLRKSSIGYDLTSADNHYLAHSLSFSVGISEKLLVGGQLTKETEDDTDSTSSGSFYLDYYNKENDTQFTIGMGKGEEEGNIDTYNFFISGNFSIFSTENYLETSLSPSLTVNSYKGDLAVTGFSEIEMGISLEQDLTQDLSLSFSYSKYIHSGDVSKISSGEESEPFQNFSNIEGNFTDWSFGFGITYYLTDSLSLETEIIHSISEIDREKTISYSFAVSYYFLSAWALNLDYTRSKFSENYSDLYQVGISFNF